LSSDAYRYLIPLQEEYALLRRIGSYSYLRRHSAAMGLQVEGSVPAGISMVLLFYNYNQPVSIVLPPEAEEAIEVPME
jgi:hypothetical protein